MKVEFHEVLEEIKRLRAIWINDPDTKTAGIAADVIIQALEQKFEIQLKTELEKVLK